MSDNSQNNLSNQQIKKISIIAVLATIIIFFVAYLPAQNGIDYTGLGKLLGFSRLYQDHNEVDEKIKQNNVEIPNTTSNATIPTFKEITLNNVGSKSGVIKPVEANNPPPKNQYESRTDSLKIIVPAGKGLEYKIAVLKFGQVKYAWKTNKGILFFDLHGDVKTANENTEYYESYTVANSNNMAGSFIAPFEGKHGWYFKNKTQEDVEVTLKLIGQYQIINN